MKHIFNQLLLPVVVLVFISGCATMGSHWKEASTINTITAYREFLRHYPKGALADEARLRIEQLHFERARAKDNISRYQHFLIRYPKGALADEARLRIEQLSFEHARAANDPRAYETFLRRHPKGAFADEARLLWLQRAKDTNTINGYWTFLGSNPKGALADEAHASLQLLKDQIQQVQEAAKSAFWDQKQAKVGVKSISRYPSKPSFCISAVLLQANSANEGNAYARLHYKSPQGLTKLVKHRCAKVLKSIAKGSKLPDASKIVIQGRLSGGTKDFAETIYQISITIDEMKKHDWSSIKEEEIMELWKVDRDYMGSLILRKSNYPFK